MLRVLPFLLCCCAAWAQTAIPLETARGVAEVPPQPAKIAVFDWAALDSLEQLGVPVGATTAKMEIDYLAPVFARAQTVGTVFEPDYEALARYQPDLVITGGPGAEAFPRLAAHWPTIDMTIDNAAIRESGKARITAFGKLFGKESEAARLIDDIDQSCARARHAAQGKGKGLVLSVTGNKAAASGAHSRLGSWIHDDLGIPPADPGLNDASHGQPVSFEYIAQTNPDWLFVLDRTASLGEKGASAKEVLNNPLVAATRAWQRGQVIIMPNANYIAAGGAKQLKQACQQLEQAFSRSQP